MASSTSTHEGHHNYHHLPTPYGATSAPPPTPSTQPDLSTSGAPADALSRLLHRLPPTLSLSLPTRPSSPLSSTKIDDVSPPTISLSDPNPALLSAASSQGFLQLTHHRIPSELAHSAESESLALLNLPHEQKQLLFPKNWPAGYYGYDSDDDEEEENTSGGSLVLDSSCSGESGSEPGLASLREFHGVMEKLGLEVVEALFGAVGFENPVRGDPSRVCSLMWVSEGGKPGFPGRLYPFVVGLNYQIRCQKYSVSMDSGWVSVSPEVDSVLVTVGDIAQVWSNGKLKKVRGRPVPISGDNSNDSRCVSMSLLLTVPMDSTVSPMLPSKVADSEEDIPSNDCKGKCDANVEEKSVFSSFSFEGYAWRIYHERLLLKDPLARYRVAM